MIRLIRSKLYLVLTALILMVSMDISAAEVTPSDLTGADKEMFDKFRYLFQNGTPDEFFDFAEMYEKDLKSKGYTMLYYKLQNNKGFYALRHNMVFRAMQYAKELDAEVRRDGATDYYYLPTGLMGDIFNACHDTRKAERYFRQALDEAGDSDPKYTMRMYMNMSEMLCIKDPKAAISWMEKSIALSKQTNNVEYYSLSLAMKAYVLFLQGDAKGFSDVYTQYDNFRQKNYKGFSPRYENIMAVAKMAFDKDYDGAFDRVHKGNLAVDSSLVVIRLYALMGDVSGGFEAMKRRYTEMDSIYSIAQDTNFDQLATEGALLKSKEEAAANKQMVKKMTNWLIGLSLMFIFVYVMGRRRLMLKIWDRNKELKMALARAEESDRMKSAFISGMSHEIRTPLNAVAGFSQVLCDPEYSLSDEEKEDMQQRITRNVNLITSIVNEVLELSESESEGELSEAEKADIACNEFCRQILDSVRGKEKAGVELRHSSNVGDNFCFRSNAYRLGNALKYLIDNAQKFTESGYIELRCQQVDTRMRFSVTDTGVGIKEEHWEHIFETFAKVDDFKEGLGLGLPISRRLVASLGGTLELDTDYHEGCRFVIDLPLR